MLGIGIPSLAPVEIEVLIMWNGNIRNHLWIFIGIWYGISACGDDKGFSGGVQTGSMPPQSHTESFTLQANNNELDIVWIIDNSGSMTEEAAQVRSNFSKFISSVSEETDLKLALISADSPIRGTADTSVRLSSSDIAAGHVQLDLAVGSTNAMAIAAAASCDSQGTNLEYIPTNRFGGDLDQNATLCGEDNFYYTEEFQEKFPGSSRFIESPEIISAASGRLTSFFRPNATRAYVFVTDDNAQTVNQRNFAEMVSSEDTKPIIYAFRGVINATNCEVANPGEAYEEVSAASGGKVFDICERDWTQHFSSLTESVIKQANNKFTLEFSAIPSSLRVAINGKNLSSQDFTLTGRQLIIAEPVIPDTNASVSVRYNHES